MSSTLSLITYTISGSYVIFMWEDLLHVAKDYEQVLENSISINGSNTFKILKVESTCTSEVVLRCAIKSFEDPKAYLLQFNSTRGLKSKSPRSSDPG